MKPTKQQELILEYKGSAIIIASPGSGKTYVISEKIIEVIKSLKEHQGVIAISYTNKASAELRDRCLKNGLISKGSFFGTIDKFNISEIIIPFAKMIWGLPTAQVEIIKIESLETDESDEFNWIERDLSPDILERGQLDLLKKLFLRGTILLETVGLLANYIFTKSLACRKYVKSKYKSIFIDEYQDSGSNQHDLFLKIVKLDITSVAVGDLNQSIYEFSGKSAKYLDSLSTDESFKLFKLDKNHRCHSSIINYSNYLLNKTVVLLPVEEKRIFFHRVNGNEINIALFLDKYINELSRQGLKNNQIAILTRGPRTAETINANLKTPHKLLITTDLDLNLNVWSVIFSNLLRFAFDRSYRFLEVISEFISFEKMSKNERKKLLEQKDIVFKEFSRTALQTENVVNVFVKIAEIIAPHAKNNESIRLLIQILSLKTLIDTYKPVTDCEVNIMTLHKSKGLEFDVIFHLDLYQWVFPAKGRGYNQDWDNPIFLNLRQDLNLHFVGITRARHLCVLVSSSRRTNNEGADKTGANSEFLFWNGIEKLRSD